MPDADPALVEAWLRGRSIARGLPRPVAGSGGWRVDTGTPAETRRHVYAAPCEGLERLARTTHEPGVFIKLCASDVTLRAMLTPDWVIDAAGFMMTSCTPIDDHAPLPLGYRIEALCEKLTWIVRVIASDHMIAASGFAARYADMIVYDRIVTDVAHQRKGLGRAVMSALQRAAWSDAGTELGGVLVATSAGRALYKSIGWSVHAPYASASRTR